MTPNAFWGLVAVVALIALIIALIRDLRRERVRRRFVYGIVCAACGAESTFSRPHATVVCNNCGRTFRPLNAPRGEEG